MKTRLKIEPIIQKLCNNIKWPIRHINKIEILKRKTIWKDNKLEFPKFNER